MKTKTTTAAARACSVRRAGGNRQKCLELWLYLTKHYPTATPAERCNEIARQLGITSTGVRINLRRDGIDPNNRKTIFHANA